VPASHTNIEAIEYVQAQGIVSGYPDGTYKPENPVNRAEFMKIVLGAQQGEDVAGSHCFPDVGEEWFAKYVCHGKDNGIVGGYPDGTFKPSQQISFVEGAKIIANAFLLPTTEDTPWYKPYVATLEPAQAIPPSISSFEKKLTRGEMAEIIYRLHASITSKASRTYAQLAGEPEAEDQTQQDEPTDLKASFPFTYPTTVTWDEDWPFVTNVNPEFALDSDSHPELLESDLSRVERMEESGSEHSSFLRVHYPKGSASPFVANSYGKPQGGVLKLAEGVEPQDRMSLRYYVRFPKGFNFAKGGDMPGLFGGVVDSEYGAIGSSFIHMRLRWNEKGEIGIVGTFDDESIDTANEFWSHTAINADGEWHKIILDVTLNTIPSKRMNGLIALYYDGTKIFGSNKVKYRTSEDSKLEGLYFVSYFGHLSVTEATPSDQFIDFAGFTLNDGPLN